MQSLLSMDGVVLHMNPGQLLFALLHVKNMICDQADSITAGVRYLCVKVVAFLLSNRLTL